MTSSGSDHDVPVAEAPDLPGLRFRRPRGDDAEYEAITTLFHRTAVADDVPWRSTIEHVRDDFERRERLDPRDDVVLAEIDGRIVGEGQVSRVVREGVVVYDLDGHVDPDWRRRGLGRALLREDVRRAAERAAAEPATQPVALGVFTEWIEVGHRALLEAEGFEQIRWFFLMRRDLAVPIPDAPLPDGLELRPMTPDHYRIVFDAEVEAFRDHWGSRVKTDEDFAATHRSKELDPGLWVVAWDGDQVAGVVQNWVWAEENASLGVERGWLEHISVRRPWRRRGLARAITAESLRRFRDLGMSDAMLGVDSENPHGALGLYESLGFVVHSRAMAWRRNLRPG
jgi:mycothiol synthase